MKAELSEAWQRRRNALVVDRKLDLAFFVLIALYSGWGWTSAIVNTTVLNIPLTIYPTFWGAAIGLSGLVACSAILSSFFLAGDQFRERITQKRVEVAGLTIMGSLIAVHPILQLLRLFTAEPPRPDLVILAFSYLVMIIYRVDLQLTRIQSIKIANRRYLNGDYGSDRP